MSLRFALIVVFVVAAFIWWRHFRIARPAVPPLEVAADHALMQEALRRARESVPQLRALAAQPNRGVRVKIPFVTSTGHTEHLWAEVLSFGESDLRVRYLTPPVTHAGRLDRVHTHSIADLSDWVVELPSGSYLGGYTMRVMFKLGREQWGTLPPQLAAEEARYLPEDATPHST